MKGYTNVSLVDIKSALENWRAKYDQGGGLRDKGIELYYEKNYTNGSWLTRLFSKKKPYDFVRSRIGMFCNWGSVLHEVLSQEELEILEIWEWNMHKEAYIAVKALLNAGETGDILLDNELCWFVNKYKGEKQDV